MQDPNLQLFTDSVWNEMHLAADTKFLPTDKEISQILTYLNLYCCKDRHPMSLSGGQKQRVCIVLAAISTAKVLLLDEPTSGLDYGNMQNVAKMLKMLSDMGKTVIVISHDEEFLNLACSRYFHLKNGKLYENKNLILRKEEYLCKEQKKVAEYCR